MKIPNLKPKYSKLDEQLTEELKAPQNTQGWWVTPEKQGIVTPQVMLELAKEKHAQTHWGVDAMVYSLKSSAVCVGMTGIVKSMVADCPICLKNNPLNWICQSNLSVIQSGCLSSNHSEWELLFCRSPVFSLPAMAS